MVTLKELVKSPVRFTMGHRLCAGCGEGTILRQVTCAFRGPTIVSHATGCGEVASSIYPYTSWQVPWMHNAFENAAAVISGAEAAYNALIRKGKYKGPKPDFVAFGGDGGTIDIGLQALSGAIERGHDFLYVLLDNGAYMNTGIQRSGGTPTYAATTTSPAGKKIPGRVGRWKPITRIVAAHPQALYVASASPAYPTDLTDKVRKGLEAEGPAFIHVISSCTLGWRHPTDFSMEISKIAVQTCVHPLWEFNNQEGQREWKLTGISKAIARNPKLKKPTEEFLKPQGRFRHLFSPEKREDLLGNFQAIVDDEWAIIQELCGPQ